MLPSRIFATGARATDYIPIYISKNACEYYYTFMDHKEATLCFSQIQPFHFDYREYSKLYIPNKSTDNNRSRLYSEFIYKVHDIVKSDAGNEKKVSQIISLNELFTIPPDDEMNDKINALIADTYNAVSNAMSIFDRLLARMLFVIEHNQIINSDPECIQIRGELESAHHQLHSLNQLNGITLERCGIQRLYPVHGEVIGPLGDLVRNVNNITGIIKDRSKGMRWTMFNDTYEYFMYIHNSVFDEELSIIEMVHKCTHTGDFLPECRFDKYFIEWRYNTYGMDEEADRRMDIEYAKEDAELAKINQKYNWYKWIYEDNPWEDPHHDPDVIVKFCSNMGELKELPNKVREQIKYDELERIRFKHG